MRQGTAQKDKKKDERKQNSDRVKIIIGIVRNNRAGEARQNDREKQGKERQIRKGIGIRTKGWRRIK